MDYGIKFEKQEERNAIEDANICQKMKEAVILIKNLVIRKWSSGWAIRVEKEINYGRGRKVRHSSRRWWTRNTTRND